MVNKAKAKAAGKSKPRAAHRSDNPDPVDVHVGGRVRLRRNLTGISQGQLAKALDLTFQQVQKYERGTNRMGASRLVQIAQVLGVSIGWLFDGLSGADATPTPGFAETGQQPLIGAPSSDVKADAGIAQTADTLKFVRAYQKITDPLQRRRIYELMRSMAEED